jgi:ribosomal protein L30/L7E
MFKKMKKILLIKGINNITKKQMEQMRGQKMSFIQYKEAIKKMIKEVEKK